MNNIKAGFEKKITSADKINIKAEFNKRKVRGDKKKIFQSIKKQKRLEFLKHIYV